MNSIRELEDRITVLRDALQKAYHELNIIRARSGVPYDDCGMRSDVDPVYFSSVVDGARAALEITKPT